MRQVLSCEKFSVQIAGITSASIFFLRFRDFHFCWSFNLLQSAQVCFVSTFQKTQSPTLKPLGFLRLRHFFCKGFFQDSELFIKLIQGINQQTLGWSRLRTTSKGQTRLLIRILIPRFERIEPQSRVLNYFL